MAQAAPYGSWVSPITSSLIVEKTVSIGSVSVDGEDLYWIEARPEEKGRSALVQLKGGMEKTITPEPFNVRSRVHEYGGGAFAVLGGEVIFSNFKDCGLYRCVGEGEIAPLFAAEKKRYANPVIDKRRGKIYAIEEEHRSEKEVINRLVEVGGKVLHEGHDFYSMPALHPEGTHIAFITWDQPNMPWDGSTLWVGRFDDEGNLADVKRVAGGEKESIFQPMWSPEGKLHYVSDRSGWWNIYDESGTCLSPMEAEFGQPLWVFGMENYTFLGDGQIASVYTVKGVDSIGMIDPKTKTIERIDLPFTSYGSFKALGNTLYFTASSPKTMNALYSYDVTNQKLTLIKESKKLAIDEGYLSEPEAIEFPTEGGRTAFGFYYPPKNKDYKGTDLPPLIVRSHGGPTARFSPVLSLGIQYWTSRGFGCLDVNYGGSTGYGRAYRERLNDNWGIVDVDDCLSGALYLVEKGKVDRERLIIKGGSAGGYTTLAALAFKDVFKAGASYYGVSDLEALANDDHKFEARYMDFLVGPFPQEKKKYEALSPIRHVDQLSCPIILFQGGEDRVVPPEQSEKMYEALKVKGIPTAYVLFEEEGHGFRNGDNIKKALENELYFYGKIFGFQPSDDLKPLKIENLK